MSKKKIIAVFWTAAILLALTIVMHHNPLADADTERLKKICACLLITLSAVLFTAWYDKLMVLPAELWSNRRLIWRLAVNDFRKRYAGSWMGAVWALVQPVVTVLLYWIVFDIIFDTRAQMMAAGMTAPYVLFLTAGLVPWFFFMEAWTNGTNSLIEYNYLVKKVVFKISILPLIKVIAAVFIHLFFVLILIIVGMCYGYMPGIYTLQLVYYMICEFVLVLSLCYATCAIAVFFRDIAQIIAIILQLGQWATPILWDINRIPESVQWVVKLNPMVYIVNGYRYSIYGHEWFFTHFYSSTYFWIVTVTLFCIGAVIFKRTKPHFADVL